MIVVLMGVSGAGKTAVGLELASRTGWSFIDGDDLHPEANVAKMSAGVPLTDDDRWPWLQAIRQVIDGREESGEPAIIACSALKAEYRQRLSQGARNVRLVYLKGEPELIEQRLRQRQGHFFDPRLLASQFSALEEPGDALIVTVDADLDTVISALMAGLGLDSGGDSEEE